MSLLNIIMLLTVLGFAGAGFSRGFVRTLASLIGMVFAVIVTAQLYVPITAWLLPDAWTSKFWVQTVAFLILLSIASKLIGLLVGVIGRAFEVIAAIPFVKTFDRLLGITFGLIEGVLVVAALLFAVTILPSIPVELQSAIDASWIASTVLWLFSFLAFFFPGVIERAQDVVGSTGLVE